MSTNSEGRAVGPFIEIDSKDNIHVVWSGGGLVYKNYNSTSNVWSINEVISSNSSKYAIRVDSSNNLHVVWSTKDNYASSGPDTDIFYKNYNFTSAVWSSTELVSSNSSVQSAHPDIALDSKDIIHITWWDRKVISDSVLDFDVYYINYNLSTLVWSSADIVSNEMGYHGTHPSIAVDSQDNLHFAWQDTINRSSDITTSQIFYNNYNRTSSLWSTTEIISVQTQYDSHRPEIIIDNLDLIYVIYHNGAGHDKIYYSTTLNITSPQIIPTTGTSDKTETDKITSSTFVTSAITSDTIYDSTSLEKTQISLVDFPLSIPIILSSVITIILVMKTKKKR
jgi:hypothetical protein